MADRHSIAEARSKLSGLVRDAERGKAVELTRRGEPVAVLIGRRQYDRLTSHYRGVAEADRQFCNDVNLEELELDPDELFAGIRDDMPGREVHL